MFFLHLLLLTASLPSMEEPNTFYSANFEENQEEGTEEREDEMQN